MGVVKKLVIGFVVLVGLVVAALVALPFIINIDQYRPEIVKVANEKINGKLAIEKLKLDLWGQIEVEIDGVAIDGPDGQSIVKVGKTYALVPFSSFLAGEPRLTFRVENPDIHLFKNRRGELNALKILKPSTGGETPAEPEQPSESAGGMSADNPVIKMIKKARIAVALVDANIKYVDETMGLDQSVKALNVRLDDVSLSNPMKLGIWANVGTQFADKVKVDGPFRIDGVIAPAFDGMAFKNAKIDLAVKLSDLAIAVPKVFNKAKGVPLTITTDVTVSQESVDAPSVKIVMHNAELQAAARLTDLASADPNVAAEPKVDFSLTSNPIDLSSWDQLLEPLKGYGLKGTMQLGAKANGALAKLGYQASLDVKQFSADVPGLLAKPVVDVSARVVTDELQSLDVKVVAPETEVNVKGSVKNFAAPQVAIAVTSPGINLDKILPPPPEPSPEQKAAKPDAAAGNAKASQEPPTDVDAMLADVRNNEFLKKLGVDFSVGIQRFQGFKMVAENIKMKVTLKELLAKIEALDLDLWKGHIGLSSNLDLKPERPSYGVDLDVSGIDMQAAVTSQMESLANTVLGKVSFKASGAGQSLNSDLLMKNLKLKGNFAITEAKFATVDVGRMVTEGVNGSLAKVAKKVPGLDKYSVKGMGDKAIVYELIGSDFSLEGGTMAAPNFVAKSSPKMGVDLRGATTLGLLGDTLSAEWFVVDTYNQTKAADVAIKEKGVVIEHVLTAPGEPFAFPVKVGCKLSAPCYDYASVPEYLGKIALKNIEDQFLNGAKARLKAEAEAKIRAAREAALKKKAEAEAKAKERIAAEKAKAQAKVDAEKAKAKKQAEDKAKEKAKGMLKGKFGF